jgi:hypothetical protein
MTSALSGPHQQRRPAFDLKRRLLPRARCGSADAINSQRLADQVVVLRRDGHVVYANQLNADGKWATPQRSRDRRSS